MRYATIIFCAAVLGACAPQQRAGVITHYDQKTVVRGFDFTAYGDFLITPEGYNGSYESVGQLQVTLYPEMRRRMKDGSTSRQQGWVSVPIDPKQAVDSLYARAKGLGADAIIRFETRTVKEAIQDGQRLGVQARGFAIDRE